MIPQNKDMNESTGNCEKQNMEENTEIGEKEWHEAETLWDSAKKMGVNEEEESGHIVGKLMSMEERDRKEAERVGCIHHSS